MPFPIDIVGHRKEMQALEEDLANGNVVHAYLFSGPKHVGKFTVAQWFARQLLTMDVTEEKEKERILDQIDRLLHPDYFQLDQLWMEDTMEDMAVIACSTNISQQHRKESKAKTNEISIEDIRALQDRLHDIGTGKYRCCLIRSAERMREPAANAFLKILEEPPQGTIFMLTSEFPSALLPTLLSRTRQLRFNRLSHDELKPLLKNMQEEDIRFLLNLAQGAPGIVQRLRSDPDQLRAERGVYSNASAFWNATTSLERFQLLKPIAERGEASDAFLLHLALSLREQPGDLQQRSQAFHKLVRGLKTNAQRKLLAQEFALAVM
ncbi:hypothetical protein A3D88_00370 [Candidatus Peribacteria bacterium RIFCSPHIGHO2_02_FULL_52_16]|nr:MAG: hypothetical protein A2706_05905 [Candidatus Peribacteria bacterium RIFCSPHIGHO2_01_FULL_51_35]OGJ61930.1 MAG: hypothetical protein A3D88_00370 [Candidatus Peribacteria bacterium RIFCSPHIGHO2_02_FULL_52_16]